MNVNGVSNGVDAAIDTQFAFIDNNVDFEDGLSFERLQSMTDFRKCHDGFPLEARILFDCQQTAPSRIERQFVMKVKIQVPDNTRSSTKDGPSTTTLAELKALQLFRDAKCPYTPHLVAFKQAQQGSNGPLPGGYITYEVMTLMPGKSLLDLGFWGLGLQQQEEIRRAFLTALKWVHFLSAFIGNG